MQDSPSLGRRWCSALSCEPISHSVGNKKAAQLARLSIGVAPLEKQVGFFEEVDFYYLLDIQTFNGG
jgi:hypothetical protein